ncbi:MAG: alpha-L-fucosidase [Planctomycetota bacterium]
MSTTQGFAARRTSTLARGALGALALLGSACQRPAHDAPSAVAAEPRALTQDERMAWWRDARFGLFLHWGLYAIPAGEWNGETGHGEWIRETAKIELPEYEKLLARFDPVKFDADAWAKAAADAGMQYVVITSKHHDGFCLFDSKETDWDVASTPFHRDVLKELSEACARHGLRFCTYHSIMDWHHPDYLPRRSWEKRGAEGADFERFERYLHAQVTEVVTRYHPAVMWFDGEWESTWNHERGVKLFDLCRRLDPAMIVNNRVDVMRGGMGGFNSSKEARGDFATPEQEIPATGMPGVDWETCMTMNDHWGWNKNDHHWKSAREIVRMLSDIASKGGNFLLNVGPTELGEFPPEALERLAAVGKWTKVNGEAIHGTTASPFDSLAFGRATTKTKDGRTTLYLHVFDWPADGALHLPGLANVARSARLLADPKRAVSVARDADGVVVHVTGAAPDADASVVAVELDGRVQVFHAPAIEADSNLFVGSVAVRLVPSVERAVLRYTTDGGDPDGTSPLYQGPFRLTESAIVRARAFDGGRAASPVSARTFTKVDPRPAFAPPSRKAGLVCERFPGDFDQLPDFETVKSSARYVVPGVELPSGQVEEHVARRFRGFVELERTGVWTFGLSSDDGARLRIDGELVVDNDGLHGPLEERGEIALAKGCHELVVEWFNKTGGAQLALTAGLAGEALLPLPKERFGYVPAPKADREGDGDAGAAPGDRARGR